MPDPHRSQCEDRSPGLPSLLCALPIGHKGNHAATWVWSADDQTDNAPTLRLPPVRESLGPRRRPPAPVVRELSERLELLRALVDELAADDAGDEECVMCGHLRRAHSDDLRFCGMASCRCDGFEALQ